MDKKQGQVKSDKTKCIMEENVSLAFVSVYASVGCVREILLLASPLFSSLALFLSSLLLPPSSLAPLLAGTLVVARVTGLPPFFCVCQ